MYVVNQILHQATGERRRHSTLFWSLVVLFLVYPLMGKLGWTRFWSLFFVVELLLAVYSVSEDTKSLRIAVVLATPAVLGELAFFVFENQETHWLSFVSACLFLAYVIVVVYRASVIAGGPVTGDRIYGALAVYLLLGLLWAIAYGMVSAGDPQAFKGLETFSMDQPGAQQEFIYFSFVTLTTLGYGDMSPVSSMARTLAWFEAVFGQLFLAVTIARLVSLQVSSSEVAKVKAEVEAERPGQ